MLDVTLPDLSRMDPSVQEQVKQGYQSMLETVKKPGASAERGRAYGSIGMLLQAASATPRSRRTERPGIDAAGTPVALFPCSSLQERRRHGQVDHDVQSGARDLPE